MYFGSAMLLSKSVHLVVKPQETLTKGMDDELTPRQIILSTSTSAHPDDERGGEMDKIVRETDLLV